MTPSEPGKNLGSASRDIGRLAGLGLQFAVTLTLAGAAGWWLDTRFGTNPWLLVAGLVCGNVIAFLVLVRSVPRAKPSPHDPPSSPS